MKTLRRPLIRLADAALIRCVRSVLLVASLTLLGSCGGGAAGGGGGIGGGPAPTPPYFPFDFEGVTQVGTSTTNLFVRLAFVTRNVSADGMTGEFSDSSTLSVTDHSGENPVTNSAQFVGTFSGNNMTLTVTPAAGSTYPFAAQYQGTFTDSNTVRLTATNAATLTLRRDDTTFIPRLTGNWAGQSATGQPWLIQFRAHPSFAGESDATVLLTGTEVLNGQFSKFTGYASIRALVLDIQRPGGTVQLSGSLTATSGKFATNFTLGNSSSFSRGGIADSSIATFIVDSDQKLFKSASLGGQPASTMIPEAWDSPPEQYLEVSPDKQRLAIIAPESNGAFELWLHDYQANTTVKATALGADGYINEMAWSPDGQSVAIIAESSANPVPNVYLISATGTQPSSVKLSNYTQSSVSVRSLAWAPTGRTLSFLSNESGPSNLYLQDPAALWAPLPIASSLATPMGFAIGVTAYQWAPTGGQLLALTANSIANANVGQRQFDVYTLKRDASELRKMNAVADLGQPMSFAWNPDSTQIAFGNRNLGTGRFDYGLFVRPANGSLPAALLSDVVPATPFEWNPVGTSIVALTAPIGSLTVPWSIVPVTGTDRIDLADSSLCGGYAHWSPDGTWLGYMGVDLSGPSYMCRIDAVRADGSQQQAISGLNGVGFDFAWVDGSRLVFLGDQDYIFDGSSFKNELFVGQAGGTGAIKLSSAPLDSQNVEAGWVVRSP